MPSLKAIRKRIGSVKNTRKITRAMKLVAAAKLRRAQDAIIAARPYASALSAVVSELAEDAGTDAHPLFEDRKGKKTAIVAFTSDRGLAGAFNANVVKKVEAFVANELPADSEVSLRLIGLHPQATLILIQWQVRLREHRGRRNGSSYSFFTPDPVGISRQNGRQAQKLDEFSRTRTAGTFHSGGAGPRWGKSSSNCVIRFSAPIGSRTSPPICTSAFTQTRSPVRRSTRPA